MRKASMGGKLFAISVDFPPPRIIAWLFSILAHFPFSLIILLNKNAEIVQ